MITGNQDMKEIRVKKFDGSLEPYDREKIVSFGIRMGVSGRDAAQIADKLETQIYDEISTKRILQLARRYLKQYKPEIGLRRDLRTSICLLRSKPDWELFLQLLMKERGYEVEENRILKGKCVDNEIDGILRTKTQTIMLEAKHHINPHTKTSLDVQREVWAIYVDLKEGYAAAYHDFDFTGALIICNTKFSKEGKKYANCRGIGTLGWKEPFHTGLEVLIEAENFYPITILREIDKKTQITLGDFGIILLKQMINADLEKIAHMTGINIKKIEKIAENARKIL